jgi:hypothetical protein
MASFALIPIFSGFSFDLPRGSIGFAPIINGDFQSVWSVGKAWGDYRRDANSCMVIIHDGDLLLSSVKFGTNKKIVELKIDNETVAFNADGDTVRFDPRKIREKLEVSFYEETE